MELSFLGTGSAYNPILGNTSAYFVRDDSLYLFDCGESVFSALYKKGLLKSVKRIVILITHFHSDHFGSLGSLISFSNIKLGLDVTVIFPNQSIRKLLSATGVTSDMYRYKSEILDDISCHISIKAIPVQHDPGIECFGYLVSLDTMTFFYGGDSSRIPDDVLDGLRNGEIDEVYQDVTYENHEGPCMHGALTDICLSVEESLRHKVVCMHFDHDFSDKIVHNGFLVADIH